MSREQTRHGTPSSYNKHRDEGTPVCGPADTLTRQGPSAGVNPRWGGWGSHPRPADYEKYGLTLRVH
jgi:hypothetical protein